MKNSGVLLALVILWLLNGANAQTEEIKELYEKGKQKCIEQKWDDAIHLFKQMVQKCSWK